MWRNDPIRYSHPASSRDRSDVHSNRYGAFHTYSHIYSASDDSNVDTYIINSPHSHAGHDGHAFSHTNRDSVFTNYPLAYRVTHPPTNRPANIVAGSTAQPNAPWSVEISNG